jgi:zinc/manganese transport system substrate-binding protein
MNVNSRPRVPRRFVRPAALAGAALTALVLASCGQPESAPGASAGAAEKIGIVASTNTYSDIAASIGGDLVEATAIIDNASQDPHSYEGTARDRLALSDAELVIRNGGGFDPFMEQLAVGDSPAAVIDAVEISGLQEAEAAGGEAGGESAEAHAGETEEEHAAHSGFNEHVWYSLPAVSRVAEEIAVQLGKIDPVNAATYEDNAAALTRELSALQGRVGQLREEHEGKAVAATAPLSEHLLTDAGLADKTPEGLVAAIEAGNDAAPAVIKETKDLIESGGIALLAYNSQVEGPQSEQLRATAEKAGVPVVDFSETLPDGSTYIQWFGKNIDQLETALGGA